MMDIGKTEPPEGKKFYGAVRVSERGQIVIPAEARKDFNIKAGDKLLVLGDLTEGIAIITTDRIRKLFSNSNNLLQMVQSTLQDKESGSK
jgi:AbrB family looped-hinge helix DNA binding protein